MVRCAILYQLYNLKKREKHQWRSVTFGKVASEVHYSAYTNKIYYCITVSRLEGKCSRLFNFAKKEINVILRIYVKFAKFKKNYNREI